MKQTIVKVQMSIDQARAARTGLAYIDLSNREMLIYDKDRKHMSVQSDPEIYEAMCNALDGQGSIKSFWLGTWDGSKWHLTEMTETQDW
jgi:hypothetical protein